MKRTACLATLLLLLNACTCSIGIELRGKSDTPTEPAQLRIEPRVM